MYRDNSELIIGAFNTNSKEILKTTMSVLWSGSNGLEQTDRLIKSMVDCMNRLDGEKAERMYNFLSSGSHGFKAPELDLAIDKFNQSRNRGDEYSYQKERSDFESSTDVNALFDVLQESQAQEYDENSWERKYQALKRIKQIVKIDDLPRLLDYCQSYDDLKTLADVQKRYGFYSAAWLTKSSELPFFSSKYKTGSITNMANHITNYGNISGSIVGGDNGTVNNTTTNLSPSDESELRSFLQLWIERQQVEITNDPEASAEKAAQALEVQSPSIVGTLKNSSIGAITSLVGDIATGEEPTKAFIKAFFAFIGGVATA